MKFWKKEDKQYKGECFYIANFAKTIIWKTQKCTQRNVIISEIIVCCNRHYCHHFDAHNYRNYEKSHKKNNNIEWRKNLHIRFDLGGWSKRRKNSVNKAKKLYDCIIQKPKKNFCHQKWWQTRENNKTRSEKSFVKIVIFWDVCFIWNHSAIISKFLFLQVSKIYFKKYCKNVW